MSTDIITEVDKYKKGWFGGLPETPCGSGSKLENTVEQRAWLQRIIKQYDIKTIADIGAGDLNWIKKMDLSGVEYIPYDLVPRKPEVIKFNIIEEIPESVDLILCFWVLNHFPYEHCKRALHNLKASGSKYLAMTDRPKWHEEQPPEIQMTAVEQIILNQKGDNIQLIKL